ncbi:tigger transposable element-derived protein 6-like [Acyrthosiphon pisum]|uniref:HTH CENPB-type domain-containing protein n=1 Tax=Acyrthosiphon pisum TaxID=7029 RepID=A0A8R2B3U8_ACYPI|nr:tigger transposable element-derived protein 6-like [Acyrthosiphon pisum]|eukprot:XP_008178777.1 PREDICTED: tigger transposable element-derived protein 6-like [Acyrthosiphon pisum]
MLIKCYDAKKQSVRELATQFKVGKTQIGTILKSRVDLLRKGFEIDHVCYEWFYRVRAKNLPISGIQEKAIEIAKTLGRTNFKASNGWLEKFHKRHNIAYKAICGESISVDHDILDDWNNKLVETCEGFVQKIFFNLDETGLFFHALPNKTMCLKGENCSGGKISKERVTVMLCVNMAGDFERPLVIGKALKPRCFKNIINDLGVTWKECETRILSTKCNFNLPTLDLGIIKNFKTHYRISLLKHVTSSIDNENIKKPNVTVLEAVMWTTAALKKINKETVTKCFMKAGFPGSNNIGKLTQVKDLSNELSKLVSTICPTNAQDYSTIDECLQTEDLSLNIKDIINDGMSENESYDVNKNRLVYIIR